MPSGATEVVGELSGDAKELTLRVPPGSGTAPVRVVNPGGSATATDLFSFARPAVQVIEPKEGPSGTVVSIRGSGMAQATDVSFGDEPANFTVVAGGVTATSPAGSGSVHVKVTTPAGSSDVSVADLYTYIGTDNSGGGQGHGPRR